MIIKKVLMQLESKMQMIVKVLINGGNFKVLAKRFKKQRIEKEGKSPIILLQAVLSGTIIYKESLKEKQLTKFENTEIAVKQIHSVEAIEDSLCLLIQG